MHNEETDTVTISGYKLKVCRVCFGYYAYLSDPNISGSGLYIRSNKTIGTSMKVVGKRFGYCNTIKKIKAVVEELFPSLENKIDYSQLEN